MEGPPTSGNKGSDRSSERWCAGEARVSVTPQTRGSVDYPSTRGILVNVG